MSLISFSDVNKLVCVQQSVEKSIGTIIEHLKKYPNYEDISTLPLMQDQERKNERSEILSNITEIIDNIRSKAYFLSKNKTLDPADLKQFKKEMILIQDMIQNVIKNTRTKLKDLQVDYFDINQDVDYYAEKIFEWSEPIHPNKFNFKADYKPPNSKLNCVEMREFIDFIRRSGGHENGWNKDDHQLFIKYRKQYKDIEVIAQKINELLPDKSIIEIKQHEEWYKKYLILKRNKKCAIQKWQNSKNKIKLHKMVFSDESYIHSTISNSSEDLKEKLIKWKLEREMKFQANLSVEQVIQQRNRKLESVKKKKFEETKKVVEEWKKTKFSLEQEELLRRQIKEQNERKEKAVEANKMIKHFQTQDDFYLLKMKQQKRAIQNQKPQRSKSSQLAARDPERVLKPTQQWINRVHDENIYPVETVIPLKKLPKLGIPEWRKKI